MGYMILNGYPLLPSFTPQLFEYIDVGLVLSGISLLVLLVIGLFEITPRLQRQGESVQ